MSTLNPNLATTWKQSLAVSGKQLFVLSTPIICSQFAQLCNGVVDVVMAGRLNVTALGAISVGASLWTCMMIFLLGLLYAMVPIIGKLWGENKRELILGVVVRGLVIGAIGGTLLGGILYFCSTPVFHLIGVTPELIADADNYVRLCAFGLPGIGLFLAVRFLTEASGEPLMVTATVVCGVILKIVCNAAFVFGYFGCPALGTAGFGISTVIVFWSYAIILTVLGFTRPNIRTVWQSTIDKSVLSLKSFGQFLWNGLPIAFNFLSEFLVLTVIALFISTISAVAISSHQIAFNLVSILTMIPTGVSMAAAILVAQALGRQDKSSIAITIGLTSGIGIVIAVIMALITLMFAPQIAALYTLDQATVDTCSQLFKIVAMMLAVDVLVIALGFILRGLSDPMGPLLILCIAHWLVSIPVGYVLGLTDWIVPAKGTDGWWIGLFCGLSVALIMLVYRLKSVMHRVPENATNP